MAKRSKSRFTDLVKFIPDSEQEINEENEEIRTNLLDDKYNDDDYDEYDAYTQNTEELSLKNDDNLDEKEDESEYENIQSKEIDSYEENTIDEKDDENYKVDEESDIDLSDLQEENDNSYQNNNYKEDNEMKREIPDFVREDKIDIQKPSIPQTTPGSQRYQAQQQASPVLDPANMKESIILGNTTIKGDVITDTGIQIYGAVIGNIESGGRVQLMGKVEGDITGKSVIITNTSLNGNIHAESDVTVKAGCVVTGDVSGGKVILNGTINGNIDAEGQVDFEAGSVIDGNVSAKSFNIKPGARINGSIATK